MNSKSKKVSAVIGASLLVAGSGVAYMISHDSSDTNKASDKHARDKDSSQESLSSLKIKTYSNIDAKKLSNYIVVKGDSTISLAKRFNVTESSLLQKFNLSKNDKLIPGVKMKDQAKKIHEKIHQSSSSTSQSSSSSDTNTPVTTDETTSVTTSSEQIEEQSTPQVQAPQPAPAVPTPAQPVVPQQAPVKQAPVQETPAPAPVQQAPAPVPVEQAPAPAQRPTAPSAPSSDPNSTNIGNASDIMNSLG